MSYYMEEKCPECSGQLWNDTEFGMIFCMDCDWHATEISKENNEKDD